METARAAAESIRDSLRPDDLMAAVHFSRGVLDQYTVSHSEPDSRQLERSIEGLTPTGRTNVQAGLDEGMRLAGQAAEQRPQALNYVILMSDGVANVDATDPFRILREMGTGNAGKPIRLITLGVGISNYNDHLLEQLAQHGDGWYRYLDSPRQARSTFTRENWLRLSTPFADQARAQVRWNPETVLSWRIIGYENRAAPDHQFTQDRKEFAEIPSGAAVTVFYELETAENLAPGSTLGEVEVRWVNPDTGESMSKTHRTLTGNRGGDPLFMLGAAAALAADRYASLTDVGSEGAWEVKEQLKELDRELRQLGGELGKLDSYNDLRFLLEHMQKTMPPGQNDGEHTPKTPPARSGYSP